jgi:hypothetical protein
LNGKITLENANVKMGWKFWEDFGNRPMRKARVLHAGEDLGSSLPQVASLGASLFTVG